MKGRILLLTVFFSFSVENTKSQQIADTLYNPEILRPAYPDGSGSQILIDEGHNNFHTLNGRYYPFARLLVRDGYKLGPLEGSVTLEKLQNCKILVISNPLHDRNVENWFLPNPSAYRDEEIEVIGNWVNEGGALFLIADHMPFPGAAGGLAKYFGFDFYNGFAINQKRGQPSVFELKNETLKMNVITSGRSPDEAVFKVVSFTGQAFQIPTDAEPILQFDDKHTLYMPDTAWVFNENTRIIDMNGWYHAAYKEFGNGRIVVAGEASMFSAQLAGPQQYKMGMNSPLAPENYKLLLNIIHWLDRKLN